MAKLQLDQVNRGKVLAEQARTSAEQDRAEAEEKLRGAIAAEAQAKATLTDAQRVTEIERGSTEALQRYETQPIHGLLRALEVGQQLQAWVQQKSQSPNAKLVNQKLALETYPALSPIYTLHQILSTIQTREISNRQGSIGSVSWSSDGQTHYIMETFRIVKRKDEQKHGYYRTKAKILEIYDAMAAAMKTGQPYQTLLDPPPADPSVAHSPR